MSEAKFARWLDRETVPPDSAIRKGLGAKPTERWNELRRHLERLYDFEPVMKYYGKSYGWTLQYRRNGKTLCSLFPEKGAFTVLVTLGPNELKKLEPRYNELSPEVRGAIMHAHEYPEGKWLWIRILRKRDLRDILVLLFCKKRPRDATKHNESTHP